MTVSSLAELNGFEIITAPFGERQISGIYIGDLLSWVMSRANEDNAWITIMSNVNVIAVATLVNVSCIIFAEGVRPDEELIKIADEKGINLICSELPAYESALLINGTDE
jgi:predicted transcriptional regulator